MDGVIERVKKTSRVRTELVVRSYECDRYAHVNHATYLNFFEYAREDFLNKAGLPLREGEKAGCQFVVRAITVTYHRPVMWEDRVLIETEPAAMRHSSGLFCQRLYKNGEPEPAVEAQVRWAMIDGRGRPVRIPESIRAALQV